MKPLKMDTAITADRVVEALKQLEKEHNTKLDTWEDERRAAKEAGRYFGKPPPHSRRTPHVKELADRLGITRAALNPFLKQLRAEHRVTVYKRVGEHDGINSIDDAVRDRALAVDARRREIAVLREQAEVWVQAHDHEPIADVAIRMECDEDGRLIPGRSTVEITTGCDDACIIALLEVVKNMGERG